MGKFITKLDVQLLDDSANDGRGIWELKSPLIYQSDVLGDRIVVPAGFSTDFASVPRIPLVFDLLGDRAHAAATVHDWLYSSKHASRKDADLVLKEAMGDTGVSQWKAQLIYLAVRIAGASKYDNK